MVINHATLYKGYQKMVKYNIDCIIGVVHGRVEAEQEETFDHRTICG